jgi:membrane dipeptidase
MISFVPLFTRQDAATGTLDDVIDHIEYAAAKVGFDYVGIGTDFDGMEKAVAGLEDVSKFPSLVSGMLKRGIARVNIEKVLGLNIIRVLAEVEKVAIKMRNEGQIPVLEDTVKQLWSNEIRAYVRSVYPDTPKHMDIK